MPKLLSDEQVQSFVRDGYIVINAPNAPNAKIFESAQSMMPFRGDGGDANPNDFIDRVIPELTEVWGSPEVHGALCSILGNDYIQHAHRHLHERLPGQDLEDQDIHVDGTVGVTAAARAQLEPWFVIGFYYPQKTTVDMGPTAVVGGTHLLDHVPIGAPAVQDAIWRPLETKLECEAGTVVLCDFRLVHKGCGNVSDKSRFMFKVGRPHSALPPPPLVAPFSPTTLSPRCASCLADYAAACRTAPCSLLPVQLFPDGRGSSAILEPRSRGCGRVAGGTPSRAPAAHSRLPRHLEWLHARPGRG